MWFELVITPDPMDRRGRHAGRRSEPPDAPLRCRVRRRLEPLSEHPPDLVIVDLARAPRPPSVEKTFQAALNKVAARRAALRRDSVWTYGRRATPRMCGTRGGVGIGVNPNRSQLSI